MWTSFLHLLTPGLASPTLTLRTSSQHTSGMFFCVCVCGSFLSFSGKLSPLRDSAPWRPVSGPCRRQASWPGSRSGCRVIGVSTASIRRWVRHWGHSYQPRKGQDKVLTSAPCHFSQNTSHQLLKEHSCSGERLVDLPSMRFP